MLSRVVGLVVWTRVQLGYRLMMVNEAGNVVENG